MTKTQAATAALVTVACTLTAQAQSGSAGSAQSSSGGDRITVTGCVERADQVSSAGAGTLGTTVDSLDFVLIKAAEGSATTAAGATAPAPTGTTGTKVTPMYRLQAEVDALNPHVGHEVEITGTRDRMVPGVVPGADAPAADAATPTLANAPRLHVESVKLIAENCAR
jgi:hypothetical protein